VADDALRCPTCAAPVVPGGHFCFQCGAALDTTDLELGHGGDRRVVTVLFGDLSEFTAWAEDLDPERVKVVTDRVLTALAHTVQTYGGHVDKLTGDGIMAIFGAPTAHEDDPERAVRAAAAMQQAVARLVEEEAGGGRRLGLRVGLNTGEVLAGIQARLSYTVVGDTVNTASRLSDAAGVGAVLAGRDTALATFGIASWRPLSPLRLKGKRELVMAYELVALRAHGSARHGLSDEAPLTGREAELGTLVSRLRDAVDRAEAVSVVMTGEAGIGKTRLAREMSHVAGELAGSRVLVGRCPPFGEARDLAPLVEMVRTACAIADDDDVEVATEKVSRTVARLEHPALGAVAAAPLTDRLLALLGLARDLPAPRGAATPGEGIRPDSAVVDALVGLFNGLSRQGPLLLVVDDLHWAGAGLLELLADVAGRLTGPVLLLAVGRPDLLTTDRTWTERLPDPTHLPLFPLEEGAASRLMRAYLGGSDLAADARSALLARAQGNPFFLAELLHLLVDRGLLRRQADGWVLEGALPEAVLPAGVQAVLAARIDSLDQGVKATLRDAAVVGPTFWLPALAALSGSSLDVVTTAVHALVERDIAVVVDAGEAYAFAHTLTREVAYSAIPKAQRARRHAAAARWAAAEMPGTPAEVDAAVAGHAERAAVLAGEMGLPADDAARSGALPGYEALSRLGIVSLHRDDNAGAADLLGRALALGVGVAVEEQLVVTRVAYGEALAGLHRLDEALAEVDAALVSPDPAVRADALIVLGDVRRKQNDDDGAVAAFVQALAEASDAGNDRVSGAALRQLGLIDYFNGRMTSAEERFTQALTLAERVHDQRGAGWALQHLAWSATTRGHYDRADEMLSRASAVFASFDDTGGLGWCAGTEAFVRVLQGRLLDARALIAVVLPLTEQAYDAWSTGALRNIEAMAAAELGDVEIARRLSAEAGVIFRELSDTWGTALSLVAQGAAERAAGEHGQARELLAEAVRLGEVLHHPTVQMLGLVLRAWCEYDCGDLDAAQSSAEQALALTRDLELAAHAEVGVQVLLALLCRARGDLDEALRVLGAIAETPELPTLLFPMRQALAHYAGTLLAAGRVEEAVAAAERALTVPAEDVRSRVVALRAMGNALAAAGRTDEARAALDEALSVATSTEHRLEEPATRAALAAL
jgi:class 3 adenylate cyclase/tetratricopeptide (TPR) repeat protein